MEAAGAGGARPSGNCSLAGPTESPALERQGDSGGPAYRGEDTVVCGLRGGTVDASVSCLGDVWMRLIARVAHAGAPAQESRPELLRGSARASRERLFMRSSTWDARRPIHIFQVLGLTRDSGLCTATNKPTIQIQIQIQIQISHSYQ